MSFLEWAKQIEKKYAWSFFGVILAVIFGLIGIYPYIHKEKVNVSFEIINETRVLDVKKSLKDLKVFFQGEDIDKKNLTLKVVTIKLQNTGDIDILQNYYDETNLWGIKVNNCKIIETSLVETNNEYILENLNPKVKGENILSFEKIIFEKEKYFIIELLLLSEKEKEVKIMPLGKIAGIDKITPVETWKSKDNSRFYVEAFKGDILIQTTRFIGYFIALIIIMVVFAFIFDKVDQSINKRKKKKRKKFIEKYFGTIKKEEDIKQFVYNKFYENGLDIIFEYNKLIENEDLIKSDIKVSKLLSEIRKEKSDEYIPFDIHFMASRKKHLMDELLSKNIISKDNNEKIVINNEFVQVVKKIIELNKIINDKDLRKKKDFLYDR